METFQQNLMPNLSVGRGVSFKFDFKLTVSVTGYRRGLSYRQVWLAGRLKAENRIKWTCWDGKLGSKILFIGDIQNLEIHHYSNLKWMSRHSDSPASRLFAQQRKKHQNLASLALCVGIPPVIGGFPSQRASHTERVSVWWHHHVNPPSDHKSGENTDAEYRTAATESMHMIHYNDAIMSAMTSQPSASCLFV